MQQDGVAGNGWPGWLIAFPGHVHDRAVGRKHGKPVVLGTVTWTASVQVIFPDEYVLGIEILRSMMLNLVAS